MATTRMFEQERLNGGESRQSEGSCPWWRQMSQKRKGLVIAIVILAIVTLALLIYILVVALRRKPTAANQNQDRKFCLTRDCVESAEMIRQYLDPTVDPCQDFYLYSCGGYIKKYKYDWMPYGSLSPISNLGTEAKTAIKNILENPNHKSTSKAINKMKLVYNTCLVELSSTDEKTSYRRLTRALADDLVGYWPPDMRDFDIDKILGILLAFQIPTLFKLEFYYNNQFTKALYRLSPPDVDGINNDTRAVYKDYVESLLSKVNFPNYRIAAEDILQFQDKLKEIAVDSKDPLEGDQTSSELGELYPFFKWERILEELIKTSGRDMRTEEILIEVESNQYLISLDNLLDQTPPKKIYTYLLWSFIHWAAQYLSLPIRQNRLVKDISLDVVPEYHTEGLWKICMDAIHPGFKKPMTAEYADVMFNDERIKDIDKMFDIVRETFQHAIANQDWIDNPTKKMTDSKVRLLRVITGYPPSLLVLETLDYLYKKLNIKEEDFLYNLLQIRRFMTKGSLLYMGKEDDGSWGFEPTSVNAFNYQFKNMIVIPISILFPPFYQLNRPQYLNYGYIGTIITHELGHSFDSSGIHKNYEGTSGFWPQSMITKFMRKAQCYINQYNNFTLVQEGIKFKVDGKVTLPDNIADQVSMIHGYNAYLNYEAKFGKEPGLPGLNYTNYQMFFIAYAQRFCAAYSKLGLRIAAQGVHPLDRFRIIGTIQNSPHFGDIFKCPVGSPMNPEKKCKLWE